MPEDKNNEAEAKDAEVKAGADRMPTPEEERVAERNEIDESVIEHERDMAKRGANQKGEGRIV